jgi:hypothetical protein
MRVSMWGLNSVNLCEMLFENFDRALVAKFANDDPK